MKAEDLLTVGVADQWFRAILSRVEALVPAGAAPGEVVLYSVAKLAAAVDVDVATVRRWIKSGKTGKTGGVVKLQAYYFTCEPRIPWPALLAYERGEPFDLTTLPAPVLAAPAAVEPAAMPPEAVRMRLAS
ncbi:hypothetical protein [Hymenobacter sp.]|uniref:hypothetical protein n=1 Tax=Hymenobacter sp. TaxID=1898978 RepID=UPI00286C889E|nr:hypothetical protein [Hymenobacter sp.]